MQPVVARLDIAPAVCTVARQGNTRVTHQKARVIVTAEHVFVYVDRSPTPVLEYTARIDSFDGRNTIGWRVVTASGDYVDFKRGGGCLCGSQLKSFRPFPEGLVQGAFPDPYM